MSLEDLLLDELVWSYLSVCPKPLEKVRGMGRFWGLLSTPSGMGLPSGEDDFRFAWPRVLERFIVLIGRILSSLVVLFVVTINGFRLNNDFGLGVETDVMLDNESVDEHVAL